MAVLKASLLLVPPILSYELVDCCLQEKGAVHAWLINYANFRNIEIFISWPRGRRNV